MTVWLVQIEQRPGTLARKLRYDQAAIEHARIAGATRLELDTLERVTQGTSRWR